MRECDVSRETDIAIIGAGPYGLSIAAHLSSSGADFRIFGRPMEVWREGMPHGMYLKSEGFACSLFDPRNELTLEKYCRSRGLAYAHVGRPVSRELFCEYGLAFQERFAPNLETTMVSRVHPYGRNFLLHLETGEVVQARHVIVAVGISHYAHVPMELLGLPGHVLRHSLQQQDLRSYAGRKVAVIGAGSSAVDMAGLLHQAGASTQLLTRRAKIWFHHPPEKLRGVRRLTSGITRPRSGLGLGWRSRIACDMPIVFHYMPSRFRMAITRGHLGPSAGWMARDLVDGKVDVRLEMTLQDAMIRDGRPLLIFKKKDGAVEQVEVDEVVAGTGYKVDVEKLTFLDTAIRRGIRRERNTPILSRNFESSCRGLYFVGVSAANSFGPLLRFAWGARFTARRLTKHLNRRKRLEQMANAWLPFRSADRNDRPASWSRVR